jgi:hypothetical protein
MHYASFGNGIEKLAPATPLVEKGDGGDAVWSR